jgi:hypothetical protein
MKQLINTHELRGDYWRFISEWLPDYSSNADVCLSNDIAAFLEYGDDSSDECKANIVANGGVLSEPQQLQSLQDATDAQLLRDAMVNFLNISYK